MKVDVLDLVHFIEMNREVLWFLSGNEIRIVINAIKLYQEEMKLKERRNGQTDTKDREVEQKRRKKSENFGKDGQEKGYSL